jgi:hypothetical protein
MKRKWEEENKMAVKHRTAVNEQCKTKIKWE